MSLHFYRRDRVIVVAAGFQTFVLITATVIGHSCAYTVFAGVLSVSADLLFDGRPDSDDR